MFFGSKRKIFCIGSNKTGTTSLGAALHSFGFSLGDQAQAELLMEDWARRDFRPILRYCRTADAFQDVPFSLDFTFTVLDQHFPRSKFILTVRDSAEQWFESLVRFHTKFIGKDRLPTADDLKACDYRGAGWFWRAHVQIFGIDESTLYRQSHYVRHYESHCQTVINYFRNRPNDLLVLNLGQPNAMESLVRFLGVDDKATAMPHLNSSTA
jgi:hypothetical protein